MSVSRHFVAALLGAAALVSTLPASAELHGMLNGRSADKTRFPAQSIDIGAQSGSFTNDLGVRYNFPLGGNLTGFAIASVSDGGFRSSDGFSAGGGVFIHLPDQRMVSFADVALKPSASYQAVEGIFGYERNTLRTGFEVLASSKQPIGSTPLNWYFNAGLGVLIVDSTSRVDDGTEVVPIVGGGMLMPLGSGQLFFGADMFDSDTEFGVGYRFFLGS